MERFENILFIVGGKGWEKGGLLRAVNLARHNQGSLTLLEVQEPFVPQVELYREKWSLAEIHHSIEQKQLSRLQEVVRPYLDSVPITIQVKTGTPFLEIIREAVRNKCDLVMKTAQVSSDLKERFFGSTDMHLLRKCPCPVWLMKPGEPHRYSNILAAVDIEPPSHREEGEALNMQILEMAASLALSETGQLHIVHSWDLFVERSLRFDFQQFSKAEVDAWVHEEKIAHTRWLNRTLAKLEQSQGRETMEYLAPQIHLLRGNERRTIPTLVKRKQADLIVMGTLVRTGLSGFLIGNTAESILSQVECSVLTVKSPSFVTPVSLNGE